MEPFERHTQEISNDTPENIKELHGMMHVIGCMAFDRGGEAWLRSRHSESD